MILIGIVMGLFLMEQLYKRERLLVIMKMLGWVEDLLVLLMMIS